MGIVPPLISLGGDLIVDRIEARGADSDQGFVNSLAGYRNFTDTQTGGRARIIEKNSLHEIRPYIRHRKYPFLFRSAHFGVDRVHRDRFDANQRRSRLRQPISKRECESKIGIMRLVKRKSIV
jgi:hypothetical protein